VAKTSWWQWQKRRKENISVGKKSRHRSNQPKISLFLSFISIKNDIWGMKMGTDLFWGYMGRLNSYLGVRRRV